MLSRRWQVITVTAYKTTGMSAFPIVLLFVVSGQSISPLHGIGSNNLTVCTVVESLFAENHRLK